VNTPPKLSTFPLNKPFERQPDATSLSQIGLRLIENFDSSHPVILGTATMVSGHLAITARHTIREMWGVEPSASTANLAKDLVVCQVLPGPEYVIWNVVSVVGHPVSDVALLHLHSSPRRSNINAKPLLQSVRVRPFAPKIGERVAAFGYCRSSVAVSKNFDGSNHINVADEPVVSVGEVRDVFEWQRDSSRLNFPSYQVSARFDAGMSGGPVFDESGSMCGIVCSNLDGSHLDGEPVSFVTTLWPLFALMVESSSTQRRAVIEMARDGRIIVTDFEELNAFFLKHLGPPPA
jgi:hypothetical protein